MTTPQLDPANTATKPRGTTADQIAEMESEGQAQGPAAPSVDVVAVGPDGRDRRRRLPGPDDVAAAEDQAIDIAGTEADVDEER